VLDSGHLDALQSIFPLSYLDDATRAKLVSRIADYVRLHQEPKEKRRLPKGYLRKIESWLASLKPSDFHSRLVTALGAEPWHYVHSQDEVEWKRELRSLADECIRDPQLLAKELPWICSGEAKSAAYFGEELAQADGEVVLLDEVFGSVLHYQSAAFARGYLLGCLRECRDRLPRINEWLDRIERESPLLACELFIIGSSDTHALERAVRLVDAGRLPATYLRGFTYGDVARSLSADDVGQLLNRLILAIERGEPRADSVAVEFVGFRLHLEKTEALEPILDRSHVRESVWRLLDLTSSDAGGEPYPWSEVLQRLSREEPARAARMAALALASHELYHKDYVEKLLIELARDHPDIVMEQLGVVMLEDSERGMYFHIEVHRSLIEALPAEIVMDWLREHGLEAARRIARHLPLPHLDSEGRPVVPPLTEFVLTEFEDDDRVFHEFCAGVHSFQTYWGDIAAQHEAEAAMAECFLNHPARRIREWAQAEVRHSRWEAQQARQWQEEHRID